MNVQYNRLYMKNNKAQEKAFAYDIIAHTKINLHYVDILESIGQES